MNIKQVNAEGFFLGEFDFAESKDHDNMVDSLCSFYGKIEYHVSLKKGILPLNHLTNNIYSGKLYIVARLDIPFKISKIESFITHEYDIIGKWAS